MYNDRAKLINFRRLVIFGLILSCLTGILVAQTFQYSRGWTNGKKRSQMIFPTEDRNDESENSGMLQVQRLQRMLELSQCCQSILPGETIETIEENFNRRKNHI